MSGSSVIAGSLGQSDVTVERKGLVSSPAQVTRFQYDRRRAEAWIPTTIEMFLGESQQLGDQIHVFRGDAGCQREATAVPGSPGVVRYDPATRTLYAEGVGEVPLGIAMGDKVARVMVAVKPRAIQGKLVVEPASLILAPGQADRLNVSVETPGGDRVATMAAFRVAEPSIAAVDEAIGRVRALKPGKTDVKVMIAGQAVTVPVEVTNEEITELSAESGQTGYGRGRACPFAVLRQGRDIGRQGDVPAVRFEGRAAEGRHGRCRGRRGRAGQGRGEDKIDASWRDKLKIAGAGNGGLQHDHATCKSRPPTRPSTPVRRSPIRVTAMRGGNRVVLTPADGLQLNVTDLGVASVESGTTVGSLGPGQTNVVADFGGQKADGGTECHPCRRATWWSATNGVDVIRDPGVVVGGGTVVATTAHCRHGRPDWCSSRLSIGRACRPCRKPPSSCEVFDGEFDDVSNDPNVHVDRSAIGVRQDREG